MAEVLGGKARGSSAAEPVTHPTARSEPAAVPSQPVAMVVDATPSLVADDMIAMIRNAVAEAMAPMTSSITMLDSRLVGLASEVTEMQKAAERRDASPLFKAEERGDARGSSRSRGRVPFGKRLGRG